MVKKNSMQLFGYKFLENIQLKRCQQKIGGRVLRVWIAKNPKRNNEIISLNFLLLDEKFCFHTYNLCFRHIYTFMDTFFLRPLNMIRVKNPSYLLCHWLFSLKRSLLPSFQKRSLITRHQVLVCFSEWETLFIKDHMP